jgi:dihydrofolate reductase
MLIRSRMAMSADGFVATDEGLPAQVLMPDFRSGTSHGFPEFIRDCDAVVMGRGTFVPALGAPQWPWPGLRVFVLASRPLPAGVPDDVVVVRDGPAAMVERLRSRGSDGDVHLVGGPRTIRAFAELGALDRLELVILPILLGSGVPLSPGPLSASPLSAGTLSAGTLSASTGPQAPLRLLRSDRTFPDGSAELVYAVGPAGP